MSGTPSTTEIWDHIDRISRIGCCHASSGEACKGHHPQGTRVVYGYEVLSKSVRGAVYSARNAALDTAVDEISRLPARDGQVSKAEVLEVLVRLKLPGA
jgi:hypothetical protein